MRRVRRSLTLASALLVASAALAACGGDDDDGGGGQSESGEQTGGEITVRGCNPENPLVPGNTAETCGGNVLDVTTAKLIKYATEDAAPQNDIAESIETEDNQNFTVTLKDDYMFSDGTQVTASSFVDAWNYNAYGPNGYQSSYFFAPIAGYADLQCTGDGEDPCAGQGSQPKAEEMSGLEVVDDLTFTIQTTEQVSNLPVRLGYTAFAPYPESFFEDPEAFGTMPVSAGPYMVEEFTQNEQIVVTKNPEYSGEFPGNLDRITFRVYNDASAAYADVVAGNLDVTDDIPVNVLQDDIWLSDLQDRGTEREQGVISTMGMDPTVDKRLDDPALRTAISMAIDRETITEQIFAGAAAPADGWVSPVVDGYVEGQCGDNCTYDPEAAKAMWEEAGGIQGGLTLTYNADSDHGPWTEAVCNSIRQALDVECNPRPVVDFATFLTQLGDKEIDGLFRQGWQMDYPSIENFLVPLYSKGASSNYYSFDNADFERLNREAAAAPSVEEANLLYQEAERLLAEDMRIIPLWFTTGQVGWSDRVSGVELNAFGVPDYAAISLN
ncbi:peptide ABC transporter substrate-binding protein [Nocardioides sediminis]|uniref:peptide ABC transporter substrate-binding protein n=1 Tax=Nocardioides sediminis TaxID=433648 RepID=UPI000D314BFF|nr:ABC transporter substrate-binding protein [Nocardioides sediminis]